MRYLPSAAALALLTTALAAWAPPGAAQGVGSGEVRVVLQSGHATGLRSADYAPNGRFLATADGAGDILLWNAVDGRIIRRLRATGAVGRVRFSRDGELLVATDENGTVQAWEVETGAGLWSVQLQGGRSTALGVSPAADLLAASTSQHDWGRPTTFSIQLLRTATGDTTGLHLPHLSRVPIHAIAFSADGELLVAGYGDSHRYRAADEPHDHSARIFDTATGEPLRTLGGHSAAVVAVDFSPDGGRVLTGGEDGTARLWDARTGRELRRFESVGLSAGAADEPPAVVVARFLPGGGRILLGGSNFLSLWDATSGERVDQVGVPTDMFLLQDAAVSADGARVLAARFGKRAPLVWSPGSAATRLLSVPRPVGGVAISPDARYLALATGAPGEEGITAVELWDLATGRAAQRHHLAGECRACGRALSFSSDGKELLVTQTGGSAQIRDVVSGNALHSLVSAAGPRNPDLALFSPDGALVATAEGGRVGVWSRADRQLLLAPERPGARVAALAFSPDGRFLATAHSASGADSVVIRSLRDDSTRISFATDFEASGLAYSPDGARLLIFGSADFAAVHDTETGARLSSLADHHGAIHAAAYSPDGRWILTGGDDRSARLWDARTGREARRLEGHASPLVSVSFSPDGTLALTSAADGTARLWSAESGAPLATVAAQGAEWTLVSADGRYDAATADPTGAVWVLGNEPLSAAEVRRRRQPGLFATLLTAASPVLPIPEPAEERATPAAATPRADGPGELRAGGGAAALRPRIVVQDGHSQEVSDLALTPDGGLFATVGRDEVAKLFDARTGRELRTFPAPDGTDVALRADGSVLAVGTESGGAAVVIWDTRTGQRLLHLQDAADATGTRDLAFMPDGRRLVAAREVFRAQGANVGALTLHDVGSGAVLHRVSLDDWANSLAIDDSGRWLVTGHTDRAGPEPGSRHGTVRLWELSSDTLALVRTWPVPDAVAAVAVSGDGVTLAAAPVDGSVHVWRTTGEPVHTFPGVFSAGELRYALAFSRDGRHLIAGGQAVEEGSARPWMGGLLTMWSMETGERTASGFTRGSSIGSVALQAGRLILADGEAIRIVDLAGGSTYDVEEGGGWVTAAQISQDGATLAVIQEELHVWDLDRGQLRTSVRTDGIHSGLAVGPGGEHILLGGSELRLLDARSGQDTWRSPAADTSVTFYRWGASGVALHPTQPWVLSTGDDRQVRVRSLATGQRLTSFRAVSATLFAATWLRLSPDGRLLVVVGHDESGWNPGRYTLWRLEGEGSHPQPVRVGEFGPPEAEPAGAFSPDGSLFVGGGAVWAVPSGERVLDLPGAEGPVAYDPTGTRIATVIEQSDVAVWDARRGTLLHRLPAHGGTLSVNSLSFTPDGRHLVSAGQDQTTAFWRVEDGREIARLTTFKDGTWVVVTPEGRFDTNNLEQRLLLHWVLPEAPFEPVPVEIFMRDYYEPRLLPRLLAGEELPAIRDLRQLNRVQPEVRIASARPEPGDSTAEITVVVRNQARAMQQAGREVMQQSGAHDLHLFRDGQIVGRVEGDLLRGGDSVVHTFRGVRLPLGEGADTVPFAVYAFNSDRVKSATAWDTLRVPRSVALRKGRAYVISLGVNAYSDPSWNLQFAANDARLFQRVLSERISATRKYEEVVSIPLISDHRVGAGTDASKAAFRAVIDLLAGREVAPALLARIPGAAQLRPATPEDLVLISLSTHGYTDEQGVFYLLPQDIGAPAGERRITPELLRRAISSDELSEWLFAVDAGEMAMIVDACHSAGAVEGAGFKPGPMGSRGLGQLAYNKGMRILAASQADDVALESEKLRQGLLTYALVRDGLEAGAADHRPDDAVIWLGEWLEYGVQRVPTLYEEMLRGEIRDPSTGGAARTAVVADGLQDRSSVVGRRRQRRPVQQPSLFDFRRRVGTVVLDAARD